MKKITTFLLLACFVVYQYGRQINYWECRLSNALATSNEQCDCEQLIKGTAEEGESLPLPVHHKHFHLDESFYPAFCIQLKKSFVLRRCGRSGALPVFINLNLASRLERPPQLI